MKNAIRSAFLTILFAGAAHATTTAVTINRGALQAGTTWGFHVSSGTVTNFRSTAATISSGTVTNLGTSTITWSKNSYTQTVNSVKNVKDYGVIGNGTVDDTAAIQAAISSLTVGDTLFFPNGTYKVTSTLNITVNRITIRGDGPGGTTFNFTPAVATRLFLIDGDKDNVTFREFTANQTNTQTGCSAFTVSDDATKLTWDHVFITGFTRYGLNLGAVYYIRVRECRFLRVRDLTSAFVGTGVSVTTANEVTIEGNLFTECDRAILFGGGARIGVLRNAFESDGDGGNSGTQYHLQFSTTSNLDIANNYIEAEHTTTGAVIYLFNTINTVVRSNIMGGQEGSTDVSSTTIMIRGSGTKKPIIRDNKFDEVVNYFLDSDQPVKLLSNTFRDGHTYKTTNAEIMAYVSTPSVVETDIISFSTWNPADLLDGSGETSASIAVSGAVFGDSVDVYPPYSTEALLFNGYVSASNTVTIRIQNETGGNVNLASGSWGVRVRKP